jgi:pimeloyl-ACP methyl ester carboxylesterase
MIPVLSSCRTRLIVLTIGCLLAAGRVASAQATSTIVIRGHDQSVRLYGTRGGSPVVVSSGDGGWIHLGPHVAEVLAAKGFFVVGFDVKAYLESFTSGNVTLRPEDEPSDYKVLADFAARGTTLKPILIGVSEGAGLSVLAATDPQTKHSIAGVLGLGLPDLNELGWRWKDALIYVTHGVPKEPTFRAAAIVERVAPTPLAAIHSTQDEFVPLSDVQRIVDAAREPKRLWIVKASDHRFSDNLAEFDRCLLEAIAWLTQNVVH